MNLKVTPQPGVAPGNLLGFGSVFIQCRSQGVLVREVHSNPFSEEVMKWAYLKMPDLCLPEAAA